MIGTTTRKRLLLIGGTQRAVPTLTSLLARKDVEYVQGIFMRGHADVSYSALAAYLATCGSTLDHVIVAEHTCADRLVGPGALLDPAALPPPLHGASFGVMAGHVDQESLVAAGTTFFPPRIAPFGYMSFQPYALGRRPVLTLFGAGLRVGQAMARARLRGLGLAEATAAALIESPSMEFTGAQAWR